jgi:heme-binding protein
VEDPPGPAERESGTVGESAQAMKKRLLRWGLLGAAGVLIVLQFVPYGRAHTNPPIQAEPAWDGPQTRALAVRACFDCHSNQTAWPWYSHIAPASWLIQKHVEQGREQLNFSEWNRPQEAAEAVETIQEAEMPPRSYVPFHPKAWLSSTEYRALAKGLAATLGGDGEQEVVPGEKGASGEGEHHEGKEGMGVEREHHEEKEG